MSPPMQVVVTVLTLLMTLTCVAGAAEGSFIALLPKEFHPNWPIQFVATVHEATGPVYLDMKLKNKDDLTVNSVNETMSIGETKMIKLEVPDVKISDGPYKMYTSCTGGLTYSRITYIEYNGNSTVILVVTDKKIYKADQIVRIRVANVDKNLKPVLQPLIITVINAANNKVERFPNLTSTSGVVEVNYPLSKYPALGMWKIHVEDASASSHFYTFKVEEFVLPKFSVSVTSDKNYLVKGSSSASKPTIEVESIYTYGRGVQGQSELTVEALGLNIKESYIMKLNADGKAIYNNINWDTFMKDIYIFPQSVKIVASVKDVTGRVQTDETMLTVHKNNVKLEIMDSSTLVIRNNINAYLVVHVSDLDGKPLPGSEVHATIKFSGIKTQILKETVESGHTRITFMYIPSGIDEQSYNPYGTADVVLVNRVDVSTSRRIFVYRSEHKNGILLHSEKNPNSLSSESLRYKVETYTESNMDKRVYYVLLNKGNIIAVGSPSTDYITISPNLSMCPESKLLVYMVVGQANEAEIVADMASFTPDRCLNKEVKVSFSAKTASVSSEVDMTINVDLVDGSNEMPGVHDVFYVGVDKSITLLQGRIDIGEEEVKTSIESLYRSEKTDMDNQESTAGGIFKQSGLTVLPESIIFIEERQPEILWMRKEVMMENAPSIVNAKPPAKETKLEETKLEETKQIRKNFPDTWLWDHGKTNTQGKMTKKVRLPDTVTSWVVSAFAMSNTGLAVSTESVEIKGFNDFFITMNLPYSIKRGEMFNLKITVFNYKPQALKTIVKLKDEPGQFLVPDHTDVGGWFEKSFTLQPNRAFSVDFPINATTVGNIKLRVMAEDNVLGQVDEVLKLLRVKPEGVERQHAMSETMMSTSGTLLTKRFDIPWPLEKIVPDSRRLEVKITGDIFGQALNNLDNLVQQPYGCGEQNMITTVPNIMGVTYISETGQKGLDGLQEKLLTNMKTGYQRELNYRHKNGAFSAWGGENGNSGSTWLTAFVIKSFSLANEYINVDPDVLREGIGFIKGVQQANGDFKEFGSVIHSEMTSGTDSGSGLTVYCLISMYESANALGNDEYDLKPSIQRAIAYIKSNIKPSTLESKKNKFMAAMSAYALSLSPNPDASIVKMRDELLQVILDIGAPWLKSTTGVNKKVSAGQKEKQIPSPDDSHDLEVTAYVLLTYVRMNRISEGIPLMKWLQSKQNSRGGYRSTQDTVMVLQALAEFGALFNDFTRTGKVIIKDPSGEVWKVDVSGERSALLTTTILPPTSNSVEVTLEGSGTPIAIVKVVYTYYTMAGEEEVKSVTPPFSVTATSVRTSVTTHLVKTCVKSSTTLKDEGMTVTTLTLPSGERSIESISTLTINNPDANRVEIEDDKIHFYTQQPPVKRYCFEAKLERDIEFEEQKPGSAMIYSYYSPENVREVALDLNLACTVNCNNSGDTVYLASMLLTVLISALISLLACV